MSDSTVDFPKIAALKTVGGLNDRLAELGVDIRADGELTSGPDSPLARPIDIGTATAGNRWCIHPMEGWDATPDGRPSDWTRRRWRHFGQSGAKLIWGGEAVAVRHDGRANPNQLMINDQNIAPLTELREILVDEHKKSFGRSDDLLVGLQLTHSGRFARPNEKSTLEPRILYRHPILDARYDLAPGDDSVVVSDDWIDELIDDFVRAAVQAGEAGYRFVDIKHCHGYLGHEFLSAHTRPGPYGGSFENRTRFLRRIVEGIGRAAPEMIVCVRLSGFDMVPFEGGAGQVGRPSDYETPYRFGFGVDADNPLEMDLDEPIRLLRLCRELGVAAVNVSCGSPYYNPHIQRPAAFPPSDGYLPPEDPLVGVARQIEAVAALKSAVPELPLIGSGYSYLQDYVPNVAQWAVANGKVDIVGLGRMVLSYWELPGDALAGRPMERKRICRTFSDCTTAPRTGLISGCFPLDDLYTQSNPGKELRVIKREIKKQADAN